MLTKSNWLPCRSPMSYKSDHHWPPPLKNTVQYNNFSMHQPDVYHDETTKCALMVCRDTDTTLSEYITTAIHLDNLLCLRPSSMHRTLAPWGVSEPQGGWNRELFLAPALQPSRILEGRGANLLVIILSGSLYQECPLTSMPHHVHWKLLRTPWSHGSPEKYARSSARNGPHNSLPTAPRTVP